MALPFNFTNPGIYISGLLTSIEAAYVTNIVNLSYVTGDILYYNGTNITNLAVGTNGHVLTLAGGVPTWAAGAASSLPDQTGNSGKYLTTNGTVASWGTITAGGDVVGPAVAVNNNLAVFDTTTGKLIKDGGIAVSGLATAAQGAKADTATQPADIANFETATQLNTRDTNNRNTDNHTSGTTNKVYTATEQTKLAGIATGATANSSDATLLARANHTGTQPASTISDIQATIAANTAVAANTAKVTNATHTGDVTGATALTIANNAVTNAKAAQMATKTYKGRTSAGTGNAEDVAVATLKTDLVLVKADVGLGNVDNTSNATERAATATLTNKRITKRTDTTTSSATPTINTDTTDYYSLTAQAADITSFTTNLSGTPTIGQILRISVTGTAARAITWGASFANGVVALPTTTVTTTRLSVLFEFDGTVWRCMASGSTV